MRRSLGVSHIFCYIFARLGLPAGFFLSMKVNGNRGLVLKLAIYVFLGRFALLEPWHGLCGSLVFIESGYCLNPVQLYQH